MAGSFMTCMFAGESILVQTTNKPQKTKQPAPFPPTFSQRCRTHNQQIGTKNPTQVGMKESRLSVRCAMITFHARGVIATIVAVFGFPISFSTHMSVLMPLESSAIKIRHSQTPHDLAHCANCWIPWMARNLFHLYSDSVTVFQYYHC